ncbi:MAG: hypothetical protein IT328_05875 [Caldilineaceae bacterium]|nr:hypothetical protein [Caldilineaceae bacterium]
MSDKKDPNPGPRFCLEALLLQLFALGLWAASIWLGYLLLANGFRI